MVSILSQDSQGPPETKSIMISIIKGWREEVGKTYKEESVGDTKRGKQKDMKEEIDY